MMNYLVTKKSFFAIMIIHKPAEKENQNRSLFFFRFNLNPSISPSLFPIWFNPVSNFFSFFALQILYGPQRFNAHFHFYSFISKLTPTLTHYKDEVIHFLT